MQDIPVELLDHFIEELYDDSSIEGQTALQSCILVSKHFRHRALKHLFQNVYLYSSPTSMAKLRQIIVSPPNSSLRGVGAYIESLDICWDPITGGVDPASFLIYKNIVAVLRELHEEDCAIRYLTLTVETTRSWIELVPEFRKVFEPLATSRHLVSLTIHHAKSLPPFIVTGPSLKKLHLECGVLSDSALPYPLLLEEVFIDHSHTFYHSPSAPRFSKLKKLEAINTWSEEFPQIWNTLCSASDTVEDIGILQSQLILNSRSDNIGQFPNLRRFDLGYFRGETDYTPSNDLSLNNIFQLFSVDRVMNHLDIVRLTLSFRELNIPETFPEPRLERGWDKLDEMFTGPFFPSLSQVRVGIDAYFSKDRTAFNKKIFCESVTEQLKGRFPRLSTSDRISFTALCKKVGR